LCAEIAVKFNPQKPDETELESVDLFKGNVELDFDDSLPEIPTP
jgi:hypothetical protein